MATESEAESMDIAGKTVLVLGGAGLVGRAVCRQVLAHGPETLIVAARRKSRAERAVEELATEFPDSSASIAPAWGDVFIRAKWQTEDTPTRDAILADGEKRRRLIADILGPIDEDIIESSMLTQMIEGRGRGADGMPAEIIVDCMNTATAVSYQDIFTRAQRLADPSSRPADHTEELEVLLASLYVPQLVRHVQLLYEAMRRAGTAAYIKVGTTGTGGMGFNIPYTHGEEKPSRLLLSKAALAGGQSSLIFLLARTPGGPRIVNEIKPAAVIGWRGISHGPIRSRGRDIPVHDCPPENAVSVRDKANLVREGRFGAETDERLEGVYIDTGENGQFSAGEFTAITALGQMELVTPEEIAQHVIMELTGGNTGRDIVAALDAAVTGPSYRGGVLREAALNRLHQLEAEHGESVAFEILGPPRLSKLLFEAHLLKASGGTLTEILGRDPEALSAALEGYIYLQADTRGRMISVGIPILLPDGERLLRGPQIESNDPHHGWVDLTPDNMRTWQDRLAAVRQVVRRELDGDTSSNYDRGFTPSRQWLFEDGTFDIGEVVAWILNVEDNGRRGKR
jgi:NAD(P)-dependent dehydrogenase (short-subunit alcohol dehydrogenase family)